jgi:hypothetical protein
VEDRGSRVLDRTLRAQPGRETRVRCRQARSPSDSTGTPSAERALRQAQTRVAHVAAVQDRRRSIARSAGARAEQARVGIAAGEVARSRARPGPAAGRAGVGTHRRARLPAATEAALARGLR